MNLENLNENVIAAEHASLNLGKWDWFWVARGGLIDQRESD